jgi:hypothetical protein
VRKIFILPLIMLAGLASCGSGQSTTNPGVSPGNASGYSQKKIDARAPNLSLYQELFNRGVDFAARGEDPTWTLEIDFDKDIRFSSQDGLVLSTPAVTGTKAMDADGTLTRNLRYPGKEQG